FFETTLRSQRAPGPARNVDALHERAVAQAVSDAVNVSVDDRAAVLRPRRKIVPDAPVVARSQAPFAPAKVDEPEMRRHRRLRRKICVVADGKAVEIPRR